MATGNKRFSAVRASAHIQQWLDSNDDEIETDEEIEDGLQSDSEIEDAHTEEFSESEDSDNSSHYGDVTTDTENNIFQSKDKTLQWRTIPFASVKGRRSKVNVVREKRKVSIGNKTVENPCHAISLFLDDDFYDLLLKHTNEEAQRRRNSNPEVDNYYIRDFDMEELRACIGILILTDVMYSKRESLENMWSETFGRPILRSTLPLKRYRAFLSCCRFDDKDTRQERRANDKLAPIRVLFDNFVTKCQSLYSPSPLVCVDETLVGFRGRCPFKVYIPSKPDRYGIKIWSMCDNGTNYVCNLQVYLGKEGGSAEQQQGARVVRDLTKTIHGSGRNVTCDNFFTSYELGKFLLEKNLTLLGTMRKNRKELPPEMLLQKRSAFDSIFAFTPDTALVSYAPRNNKTVLLLFTMHDRVEVDHDNEAKKPFMVLDYNSTKGAVDAFDKVIKGYTCARGSRRWPMRLFFFVVDAACLNSFVIFSMIHSDWRSQDSSKRRTFLTDAAHDMIKPFIHRRSINANISHIPTVARAMLAIGVTPNPQRERMVEGKKRGRCQSCKRAKEQKSRTDARTAINLSAESMVSKTYPTNVLSVHWK